ncbi:fibrinogen C domain-containing protein 1-like [Corticium candelabrum]|uniref:fibrinogen C domain-containing protein 1-like n=1 Tax=Corticium candelabrum TaxID=121492 RepID=UPI002E257471|nr:fibrinogen C domain-containing protein 1-like [Corticium candelabrum]
MLSFTLLGLCCVALPHLSFQQVLPDPQTVTVDPCTDVTPRNCYHAKLLGHKVSGVYVIDPRDGLGSFTVYCDMETDGGGWTVFQRRRDGSVDFDRNWNEYKQGFGNVWGEFWLGLDKIHRLSVGVKLRVDLMSFDDEKAYALYEDFSVGDEASMYVLYFGSYSGTAGDSLRSHILKSMKFTTKDSDNDKSESNCSTLYPGGWWHNTCYHANLNGLHVYNGKGWQHVVWLAFKSTNCLQKTEMKVRNG